LLSDAERAALLDAGRTTRWRAGDVVVRRGDPADSAFVLLAGLVKVHTLASGGAEVVLGFSGPGDLLGETSAIKGGVRLATVTAIDSVEAVVIPVSTLRAFLADHPRATLALLELALTRLYVSDARRMEFANSESLARVTGRLVELAERFGVSRGEGVFEIPVPISQEELASWSASSRESTGRALRTLRDLRLIETGRRHLTVLSLDRLRAHAPPL
jgi:CRP-like cAMP-binding protein